MLPWTNCPFLSIANPFTCVCTQSLSFPYNNYSFSYTSSVFIFILDHSHLHITFSSLILRTSSLDPISFLSYCPYLCFWLQQNSSKELTPASKAFHPLLHWNLSRPTRTYLLWNPVNSVQSASCLTYQQQFDLGGHTLSLSSQMTVF